MSIAGWIVLAALLPFVAAVSAKAGGEKFDNQMPREWLAKQVGWRARANAAQANTFEALPFFYVAILYAHFSGAQAGQIHYLAGLWLVLRLLYIGAYILNIGLLRSGLWAAALLVNIWLLFQA